MHYPLIPGSKTSGCSADAAAAMRPKAPKLRSLCMAVLASGPQTADEVAARLGESVLSVRPRFSELRALGLIKPVGLRRPSSTGASSSVWRAVGNGGNDFNNQN